MNIAEETGRKIRHYRKTKQMTVEQLATAIRKSKSCRSEERRVGKECRL